MSDNTNMPAIAEDTLPADLAMAESTNLATLFGRGPVSPALAIMLNPTLFDQVQKIARYMANARGAIPQHLLGCPEACFSVAINALVWKLNPFPVAMATYQTPGGRIGYEGKLVQAIIENSGKVRGRVRFVHYHSVRVTPPIATPFDARSNDQRVAEARLNGWPVVDLSSWSKVQGQFNFKQSAKGNDYPVPAWDKAAERGLGVTVSAEVIGEVEPREMHFDLIQAFPRNSTLWATDPKTQIQYAAVRRFASTAMPGLLMGIPEWSDEGPAPGIHARDITPEGGFMPAAEPTRASMGRVQAEARRPWPASAASAGVTTVDPAAEPRDERPAPQAEPQPEDERAPEQQAEDAATWQAFDEHGEPGQAFFQATDFLRFVMETTAAVRGTAARAQFLENNRAMVMAARQTLGDHPLATQAADFYAPPAAPAAPPQSGPEAPSLVPPVVMKQGKPDVMAWNTALDRAAAQIRDLAIMADFRSQALAAAQAAGLTPGLVNSLKLRLARYQGEVEALNR